MKSESYKILAEHFADKDGLRVVFENNAVPSTDGETITLPSEVSERCLNPLLGALLHETAHIKHSVDCVEAYKGFGQFMRFIINALEDIRVDAKTAEHYRHSYDFIRALGHKAIERKGESLRGEDIRTKVLKGLIFKGMGLEPSVLYSPEDCAVIERFAPYVDKAKSASDTWAIVRLARELLADMKAQDEFKNEGAPTGAGADGAKSMSAEEIKKLMEQSNGLRESMKALEQGFKEKGAEREAIANDYRSAGKHMRQAQSMVRRYRNEQGREELKGNVEKAERAEKRAEEKLRVAQEIAKRCSGLGSKHDELGKEREAMRADYMQKREDAEALDKIVGETLAEDDKKVGNGGCSVNGFSAIEASDLRPEAVIEFDPKPIEEIIEDALLAKRDAVIEDEQGLGLNQSALAYYSTDPERLFNTKERKAYNTKVAFVLDTSGSMGDFSTEGSALNRAFSALDLLMSATKNAIEQGAPADMALYAFGNNCEVIINNCINYDRAEAMRSIMARRCDLGGGTEILKAVNKVTEDIKAEAEHRTVVVITDAECTPHDLDRLANEVSGDAKYIYIAIGGALESDSARALFGENNITEKSNATDIIGGALIRSI